jgi:aspartate/methionine/tyrosine aminotransferase
MTVPHRFPRNDIIALTRETPRHDLAESVGPDLRLADLVGSGEAWPELVLGYRPAAGDARLRQLIADQHGVQADEVVTTIGGMHALFLLAFILCERGDEAVITAPVFPLARNVLNAVGAELRTLPLGFDSGYQPDLAALRRLLSPRTRLVSLASPQNPSGVAIPAQTLREIVAMMDAVCPQAFLLVDETYREAAYGDDAVRESAVALGPKVVSVASLSKCHGAPALRLGWAITRDPDLREQLLLGKFNTVICASPLDEALALKLLDRRDAVLAERRRHLADGLAATAAWVQAQARCVEWVRPDAGALCCVRLKPGAFPDAAAVARFYAELSAQGARVGNGHWFGEDDRVFRLGFGLLALPQLDAALAAAGRALQRAAAGA